MIRFTVRVLALDIHLGVVQLPVQLPVLPAQARKKPGKMNCRMNVITKSLSGP